MGIFQIDREITEIAPDVIFRIADFPITNTFLMIVLIIVLLSIFAAWLNKRISIVPGRFQLSVEVIYEEMLSLVGEITGDRERSKFIFPLIGSVFVYIGLANLIGFVPGVTSFTYEGASLFRIATTDFNTTFGLALGMVVLFNFLSLKQWGFFSYVGRFVKFKELIAGFKQGIGPGFLALIEFFVGLLDIISEFAKIISLSMRLFGNIYAGEVLAVIILGAFAYGLPTVWMVMSMLFAVVQAVVFGALAVAYYDMSVAPSEST